MLSNKSVKPVERDIGWLVNQKEFNSLIYLVLSRKDSVLVLTSLSSFNTLMNLSNVSIVLLLYTIHKNPQT